MYNLNQFVMIKKHLLGGALLVSVLVLLTGCKEMMSSLDNPVSAYFEVTPTQATIAKNQTCQISYSTISDGKVTFKSSAENIATVDAKGLVTGKTAGTAIITVELAATPYYQGATKNVEVTVDAVLSIDATEVTVGYGASINLVKDYHLARKGDATINYEIIEGGDFITLDETTKDITGKACGNAKVKVSVPASATASSDELVIDVKARVQDLDQLKKVIAASDDVTALLGDNVAITLNEDLSLTGKKVTIKGNEKKPAIFTVTKSIRGISDNFTIENVKFDASAITGSLFILEGSTVPAKNQDGTDNADYKYIESIKLSNLEVTGLVKAFVRDAQKIYVANLIVDNCFIGFNSQQNVFDFNGKGYPANLKVTNSTIWAPSGKSTNYLLQSGGRVKDFDNDQVEYKQYVTVENCTFYRVAQGMQINNLKGAGQKSLILTLKNSILVDSGTKAGNEVRGWLGGQNSTNPSVTYEKNTYWAGDAVAGGWTDSSKQGYDASGTSLTSDPNFKDAANAIFTPQGADQVANQTGDPRWYKVN